MSPARRMASLTSQLNQLEKRHGRQRPTWPTGPYEFLLWWHSGYPASDARCSRGWAALNDFTSLEPKRLVACKVLALTRVLKAGGLIPDLRAQRIKAIAQRVLDEFDGDLSATLARLRPEQVRKALKGFPGMGDPGAERIMLFAGIAPIAAIPSNATQVAVRLQCGGSLGGYAKDYRQGADLVESATPATLAARQRAYLLLKVHGETLCTRSKPACADCPVAAGCAYPT